MLEITVYGAKWCGPCKQMQATVRDYCLMNGHFYHYVDVETAEDCSVKAIPTTEIANDGEVIGVLLNNVPWSKLDTFVRDAGLGDDD